MSLNTSKVDSTLCIASVDAITRVSLTPAMSGTTFIVTGSDRIMLIFLPTLDISNGVWYNFYKNTGASEGQVSIQVGAGLGIAGTFGGFWYDDDGDKTRANTTTTAGITFAEGSDIGDSIYLFCDGTRWYANGQTSNEIGITFFDEE